MSEKGWIGVDLDGTLAHYEGWKGIEHIGAPIAPMVDRVKRWIEEGREVRIFTARVATDDEAERAMVLSRIDAWCDKHIGHPLQVTNVKDFGMVELWDDRAVQVTTNTGVTVHESAAAVARVHSEAYESMFADVGLLLEALGKPNVARPISAHEVMLECIEDVKHLRAPMSTQEHEAAASAVLFEFDSAGVEVPSWPARLKLISLIAAALADAVRVAREERERTRIVNLLCDRCRAGEPVVERRLPNMGLGHTLPGIPHPGWARCYAEEIHADLRSRSSTSNWPEIPPHPGLFTPAPGSPAASSESPSLTRLKAAAADLDAMVKGGAMCQANLGTLELGCRKPLRHDGQHEGECAGYLITWGESRKG